MKYLSFFLLLLVLIPTIVALPVCEDQTDIDLIPCVGYTKVLSCSGNVTVLNLNTSQSFNRTTTVQSDSTYNFTFPFNRSTYSVKACDNSTALIIVGDFEGDRIWKFALLLAYIGTAFIFGAAGRFVMDASLWIVKSFLYISSLLVGLIGVQSGFLLSASLSTNVGRMMNVGLYGTIAAIGILILYMFIFTFISVINALKGIKSDRESFD